MVVPDPAAETLEAPADVAERLGLPASSQVVRRRRRATIDTEVVQVQEAWYPLELARRAGLDRPSKVIGGVLGAMAEAGFDPTEAEERIRAWVPTADEAAGLDPRQPRARPRDRAPHTRQPRPPSGATAHHRCGGPPGTGLRRIALEEAPPSSSRDKGGTWMTICRPRRARPGPTTRSWSPKPSSMSAPTRA
ncbi:UTRA domain-containing protein [Streptomyces sp. NPDC041068]|uniref:UTRA domain-containing protein n=1 Tax=Streptomyces sp. NPDC041068 TaxID=3155130 RepID=UPI00340EE34C